MNRPYDKWAAYCQGVLIAVDLFIVEPYQVGVEAVSKAVNGSADRVPRNKKELLFKSRGVDVERASQEVFCWLRRFSYRLACTQGGEWDVLSLVVVFLNNYRGVAQLAARVVWDHEAGSSSLPTPTTLKAVTAIHIQVNEKFLL